MFQRWLWSRAFAAEVLRASRRSKASNPSSMYARTKLGVRVLVPIKAVEVAGEFTTS